MVSQAKNLTIESNTFRRQSHRLQQSTEWFPVKRMIMIFLFGIFVLSVYIILAFNCGGLFLANCFYKSPSNYISEPFIRNQEDDKYNIEVLKQVDEFITELNTNDNQLIENLPQLDTDNI